MYQLLKITVTVLVLYSEVFLAVAKQSPHYCDVVSEDHKQCFIKDMLLSADHNANQIAVDKKSNTLYFSFDAGQGEFNPAMLNIETKKLKLLKGVKDAYAIASDDINGDVYFGGSNGIYKYIPAERKLMRLQFRDLDVWWLFIQGEIYYIQFPKMALYKYERRSVKPVKPTEGSIVHQFAFDYQKNILFTNATGLFLVHEYEYQPIILTKSPLFLSLAVDNKGKMHMSSSDGIYFVNSHRGKIEVTRLVGVPGVLAMAFDKNNHLIYSDSHDIVRLLPMHKRKMTSKMNSSEYRPAFVCHKQCDVMPMRVNLK